MKSQFISLYLNGRLSAKGIFVLDFLELKKYDRQGERKDI